MAKEVISLVSNEEQQQLSIQYQIKEGLLSSGTYNNMPTSDQKMVNEVLFNMYSQDALNVYQSMSGLEFITMSLAKLLFQIVPYSGSNPPTEFDQFYYQVKSIVDNYPLPLQSGTWQIDYLQSQMETVLQNRNEYQQVKKDITGSI